MTTDNKLMVKKINYTVENLNNTVKKLGGSRRSKISVTLSNCLYNK